MHEHDAYRRQQADCGHAGDVGRACGRCTECVRHELAKVRAELEEAKRAAFVGWFSVCAARNWGFDPTIDHVKALLGVELARKLLGKGRS